MQTSNFTDSDILYIVESKGRGNVPRKLPRASLPNSVPLPPSSYKASLGGVTGTVHFYVQESGEWTYAGSGTYADSSALVTLVGAAGQYRVEIAYPSVPEVRPEDLKARQEQRNAAARSALLEEFGAFSAAEVNDRVQASGEGAPGKGVLWQQEGRIFGVTHQDQLIFPAFQFDPEGRPREVIAALLDVLSKGLTDWQLALWFIRANGWLGGRRPVDLLESEPEAVMDAAGQEASGLDF